MRSFATTRFFRQAGKSWLSGGMAAGPQSPQRRGLDDESRASAALLQVWFGMATQPTETRGVGRFQAEVTIRVYRHRTALLARLAHDLEIRLDDFHISEDKNRVEVEFAPASLKVNGALVDNRVDETLFDAAKRAEIERNIRTDVLKTHLHPRGRFSGHFEQRAEHVQVTGVLELLGIERELAFELARQGEHFVGCVSIQPSHWGISPYRALLGALKLQDRVDIHINVAA